MYGTSFTVAWYCVLICHWTVLQPIDQRELLCFFIQAWSFCCIVQLTLSTPPFDSDRRGVPVTMMHSGQRFRTSDTTLLSSYVEIPLIFPTNDSLSQWHCLFVVAAPENSFPLSVWIIIGAPMVQKIAYNANAMHDARFATRGTNQRNLTPWSM